MNNPEAWVLPQKLWAWPRVGFYKLRTDSRVFRAENLSSRGTVELSPESWELLDAVWPGEWSPGFCIWWETLTCTFHCRLSRVQSAPDV